MHPQFLIYKVKNLISEMTVMGFNNSLVLTMTENKTNIINGPVEEKKKYCKLEQLKLFKIL